MTFIGGLTITALAWLSAGELLVRFSSTYTDKGYQLYAGKQWIGTARHPSARRIVGLLTPSHYPQHIRVVACDLRDLGNDNGDALPPRPYNVVELIVSTAGYPSDAERLDLTAGTTPGGAVDSSNLQQRIILDGNATSHNLKSQPLGPSGSWNLAVTPYDDKPPSGNAGTALATSQTVAAHPPDLAGSRFTAAASGGTLTVDTTIPDDS